MNFGDIAGQRLVNQHLLHGLADPVEVVRSLVAVQAQDFTGAKWGVGMRTQRTTDEAVCQAYNDGRLLRAHVLRPTWHLVAAEDIRWLQALTGPRVHVFNRFMYKQQDLNETTLRRGIAVAEATLAGGRQLTRTQLKSAYEAAGIRADGLRLTYLIMFAELEGVLCSGRLQGKQHTLALVAERAPSAKTLEPDEALVELTRRFFASHGPATIHDFAWWSSLTIAQVKRGLALAELPYAQIDDERFYHTGLAEVPLSGPVAHLLPNYDEYIVGYHERRPLRALDLDHEPTYDDLSYHILTLNGQLVGGWRRGLAAKSLTVQLRLFRQLSVAEQRALTATARELERFSGLSVTVAIA